MISVVPPVAKGIISVIGFVGQSASAANEELPIIAIEQSATALIKCFDCAKGAKLDDLNRLDNLLFILFV